MWDSVKLGDVCDFQGGSQPPKKEFVYEEQKGYVRFIQIRDFKSDKNLTYIPVSKKNRLCNANDIFIGRYGASVGQILGGLEGAYNVALMKTIPNEELISKGWLFAYLNSPLFQKPLIDLSTRSAQNGFTKDEISTFELPLPPLAEQERIVAKLDAAFAEIDRAIDMSTAKENEVKKLDRFLLENLFKENFDIKKIGDLGDVKSGGTPKSTEQSYWNGEIDWYSSGELNNMYTSQTAKHITNKGLSNSNAKIFPKGSLLVGMYDTAAMKMSILQKEATFNQAIVGIPPNEFALPEYLFYALNFLKPKILLKRRGVRQQNLSLAKIKNIDIPIPSMEQQQYIVSQANIAAQKTESILKTLSSKKAQFGILKSAILSQELQSSETA